MTAKTTEGYTLLMHAASDGNIGIVRFLLGCGPSVNDIDHEKQTMLMLLGHLNVNSGSGSKSTNLDLARLFIDCGVPLDAQSTAGVTALMIASLWKAVDVVRLLVDRGASVNEVDENGWTALMFAVSSSTFFPAAKAINRLLISAGADVNAKANNGQTTLMIAASDNSDKVCEILIDHAAHIDAVDEQGVTALMLASSQGFLYSVRLFF